MTEITFKVEEWAQRFGPEAVAMAYVTLENEKRMDEWSELIAEGATYTASFDAKMPTTVDLRERMTSVVTEKSRDLHIDVQWLTRLSPTMLVFEVVVSGTFEDGRPYSHDVVVKMEFDETYKIKHVRSYYFQPAIAAELLSGN